MTMQKVKKPVKQLVVSAVVALVLVVADYAIQNVTYPLFDDVNLLTWVDRLVGSEKDYFDESDVTYVNISKDKMLVPSVDEWGDTVGSEVISDRGTLLRFLELAERSAYQYIFLDVRFEKGLDTPYDSALFAQIGRMRHLTVATHRPADGYAIADSALLAKASLADYRNALHDGFSRYEFLQDGRRSVALQMLCEIDHHDVEKRWYGYVCDDGHLCYNLRYLPLPSCLNRPTSELLHGNTMGEEVRYPYLGSQILNPKFFAEDEVVDHMLDGKLVVVGDFDNDVHDTYIGDVPGPVIPLAAYKYLKAGMHRVNWLYVAVLFLLFFAVSYGVLIVRHMANIFVHNSLWNYLLSLCGIGGLFFIVKVLFYVLFSTSMIMVVPTLVFHLLGNLSTYRTLYCKLFHINTAAQ